MLPATASLPFAAKCAALHADLQRLPGAVVAFSGGVTGPTTQAVHSSLRTNCES